MLNSTKNKKEKVKSRFISGKKITTLILCIAFAEAMHAQSPDWLWAKQIGGTNHDLGYSMALDASSNIYYTGYFQGTADFDPGAGVYNLTSAGSMDIFISKLDSAGNFVWAKQLGGSGGDIGESIVTDETGNVYITGLFSGTGDFDPGIGVFNLTSTGSLDIFVSKLDSSGNFVWAKQMGGAFDDEGWSLALSTSGNVYVSGNFNGTADFDPGIGTYNLTSAGQDDIFISKLDGSGNFVWARAMGAAGVDESYSIAVNVSGSVYTFGHFQGTVDFDPGAGVFNLASTGSYDFFISKIDASGNFVWAKAMGGSDGYVYYSIALDAFGNVYTTSNFMGTSDFDPGAGTFYLTSSGAWDIFISKLDSSGNFIWAKIMGGTGYETGSSIAIDREGNGDAYTTGFFEGTVDFDPGPGVFNLTEAGWGDIFLSKLDSAGNFVWAKAMPGPEVDLGQSVAINSYGNVYLFGGFGTTITFSSTMLSNVNTSGGTWDTFIAKLDAETIITGENDVAASLSKASIFPNPFSNSTTISFTLEQTENVSLKIFDVNGRLVKTIADGKFAQGNHKVEWNAANVEAGIYLLRFETASYSENRKLIVTK